MTPSDPSPSSLGEFLRQEREKRGFTIEQVASATKIGVKILHQLESDQYHDLPAVPFIRGFVTSYTRFIGLDPREVLTRFAQAIEKGSRERPNRESGHSGYAFEKREGDQTSRTILSVIMAGFAVIAAIGLIFLKPSRHHRSTQIDRLRATRAEPSPGISSSPQPSPSAAASQVASTVLSPISHASAVPAPKEVAPSPTPVESEGPDPLHKGDGLKHALVKHKLVVRADNDLWVRYQADSRPTNQMILRKGRVLVIKAAKQMVVQLSEPANAHFSYNSTGFRPALGDPKMSEHQGNATLIFPVELAEKIGDPFPGASKIAGRSVPHSPNQKPSPTPEP